MKKSSSLAVRAGTSLLVSFNLACGTLGEFPQSFDSQGPVVEKRQKWGKKTRVIVGSDMDKIGETKKDEVKNFKTDLSVLSDDAKNAAERLGGLARIFIVDYTRAEHARLKGADDLELNIKAYDSGDALMYGVCAEVFNVMGRESQGLETAQDLAAIAGTATGGFLGIAGASATAMAYVSSAFGTLLAAGEAYRANAYITLDTGAMSTSILKGMDKQREFVVARHMAARQDITKNPYSFADVARDLTATQRQCQAYFVTHIANKAISNAEFEGISDEHRKALGGILTSAQEAAQAERVKEARDKSVNRVGEEISKALGVNAISFNQLTALYWVNKEGIKDDAEKKNLCGPNMLGELAAKVCDKGVPKVGYEGQAAVNTALNKLKGEEVDLIKDSIKGIRTKLAAAAKAKADADKKAADDKKTGDDKKPTETKPDDTTKPGSGSDPAAGAGGTSGPSSQGTMQPSATTIPGGHAFRDLTNIFQDPYADHPVYKDLKAQMASAQDALGAIVGADDPISEVEVVTLAWLRRNMSSVVGDDLIENQAERMEICKRLQKFPTPPCNAVGQIDVPPYYLLDQYLSDIKKGSALDILLSRSVDYIETRPADKAALPPRIYNEVTKHMLLVDAGKKAKDLQLPAEPDIRPDGPASSPAAGPAPTPAAPPAEDYFSELPSIGVSDPEDLPLRVPSHSGGAQPQ